MYWTTEEFEIAKPLWESGWTASAIADRLPGKSRSAVISKMHRSGVVSPVGQGRATRRHFARQRGQRVLANQVKRAAERRQALLAKPPPPPPADDVARITNILELKEHHCRWPVGDPLQPGFGYCGCDKVPGTPYCETHFHRCQDHAAIARQKARRHASRNKSKEAVLA